MSKNRKPTRGQLLPGPGVRRRTRMEKTEEAYNRSTRLLLDFNKALMHTEAGMYLISRAVASRWFWERWKARRELRKQIAAFRARAAARAGIQREADQAVSEHDGG